jgi:hypothetical protein
LSKRGAEFAFDLNERSRPYRRIGQWAQGVWLKWRVILAAAFVNLVVSNGLEVTVKGALHWHWAFACVDGMGMSWKAAVAQAILHSLWSGATHIAGQKKVSDAG